MVASFAIRAFTRLRTVAAEVTFETRSVALPSSPPLLTGAVSADWVTFGAVLALTSLLAFGAKLSWRASFFTSFTSPSGKTLALASLAITAGSVRAVALLLTVLTVLTERAEELARRPSPSVDAGALSGDGVADAAVHAQAVLHASRTPEAGRAFSLATLAHEPIRTVTEAGYTITGGSVALTRVPAPFTISSWWARGGTVGSSPPSRASALSTHRIASGDEGVVGGGVVGDGAVADGVTSIPESSVRTRSFALLSAPSRWTLAESC